MAFPCRGALLLALLLGTASLLVDGCKGSTPAPADRRPDWDRVAFALQLVRDEYGEQMEIGDLSGIAALATVLDGAVASLGALTDEMRPAAAAVGELRAGLLRHEPPRTVAKTCTRLLAELAKAGRFTRRPPTTPDLGRGAGHLRRGLRPLPWPAERSAAPAAAHMIPQPTETKRDAPDAVRDLQSHHLRRRRHADAFLRGVPARECPLGHRLLSLRRPVATLHTDQASADACRRRPRLSQRSRSLAKYGWGAAPCLRRNFAELPDPSRSRRSTRRRPSRARGQSRVLRPDGTAVLGSDGGDQEVRDAGPVTGSGARGDPP